LQERIQKEAGGLCEGSKVFRQGILLLEQMLQTSSQLQKSKAMQDLREQDRKSLEEVLCVLQEEVLQGAEKIGLLEAVQIYQAVNRIQRQLQMCKWSCEQVTGNSSHRRKPIEQCARKFDNDVQVMPYKTASGLHTSTIQSVRHFGNGEVTVYDFTVEGNSNFFAEGILVHNCDDPINPDEALSDTIRNSTNETIRGTLFSRFNDPKTGRFILNMQRLHEDDPTGNLLKEQGWYLLKLPAENRTQKSFSYSVRGYTWELKPNELLNPKRLDREVLDKKLELLGEYNYSGQFLQEPVPIGGGELNDAWLQYYQYGTINTKRMNVFILVDPANEKKKNSDWSVFAVIGLNDDNNYYILDMVRDRLNPTERVNTLFMLHRKWNTLTGKPPKVGYEKYGMMTDTHYIDVKKKDEAYHFPLVELGGGQKKEDRIRRIIPDMQMWRWYVPHNLPYVDGDGRMFDLVSEMKSEMKSFPRARFDDMCDAITRIYEPELFAVFPLPKQTLTQAARVSNNDGGYSDFMDF